MTLLFFILPAVVAGLVSFALTPAMVRLSKRVGAMDQPDARKVHQTPIPRLGGLAVLAGFVAVIALLFPELPLPLHRLQRPFVLALGLGLLPVLVVSVWDDIKSLPASRKFLLHIIGAGIAVALGIVLPPDIHLFGMKLHIGWLAIPISIVWIAGVTNAFNIIDGLDGLSAGLALISALSLAGVLMVLGRYGVATASLVLGGALIGFLPFNVYPARVFLGDSGAASVGFILACFALASGSRLSAGMAILVPILVLGLPLAETVVSMARRFLRRFEEGGESSGIFGADRHHFHHRLLAMGYDHRSAVMTLYLIGIVGAGLGVLSLFITTQYAALLLVTLVFAAFLGLRRLGYDEFALIKRGVVLRFYETPVLKWAFFPVFVDLAFVVISLYGAIVLKYDDWGLKTHRQLAVHLVVLLPATTLAIFSFFRVYRGAWKLASGEDLLRVATAVFTASAAGSLLSYATWGKTVPQLTLFIIYTLLLTFLVTGSRASYRILAQMRNRAANAGEPVIIYGAGRAGAMVIREVLSNSGAGLRPIGFIDDDPRLAGRLLNGYPVFGALDALERIIDEVQIRGIVIASDKIPADKLQSAAEICERRGVRLQFFRIDFTPAA